MMNLMKKHTAKNDPIAQFLHLVANPEEANALKDELDAKITKLQELTATYKTLEQERAALNEREAALSQREKDMERREAEVKAKTEENEREANALKAKVQATRDVWRSEA